MDVNCHVYFLSVIIVGIICDYHTKAEELYLCQHESKEIQCGSGQRIKIETMKQDTLKSRCRVVEKKNCISNFTLMKDKCNGRRTCRLHGFNFSSSACKVYPRYVSVAYTCISKYSRYQSSYRRVCNLFNEVSCGVSFWMSNFVLQPYWTEFYPQCDIPLADIETCLKREFTTMCSGNQHCNRQKQQQHWCFLLPYSIYVSYRCADGYDSSTGNNKDKLQTVPVNKNTTPNISGHQSVPGLRGTPEIPSVSGAAPSSDVSVTPELPSVSGASPSSDVSVTPERPKVNHGNVISTSNNKDHTPTVKVNSENENRISKATGFPVSGTPDLPSVSGVTPPVDLSDTSTTKINYGLILASCGGVLLLAVILISTFCLLRYKRKLKKTDDLGNGGTRLRLFATETRNNEHSNAELATQDGQYSEISLSQNASNSTTQYQENAYFILEPNARYFKPEISSNEINNAVPDSGYSDVYHEDDQYAVSSEGVYDVTNSSRHKESDNIYSHTTEDVYDISSYNRTDLSDGNGTYS